MNRRNLNKMIQILGSIFSTCIILAPEIPMKIAQHMLAGTIIIAVVFWKYDKIEWRQYVHKEIFLLDSAIVTMMCNDFYNRWLPSSKVAIIAGLCHLQVKTFLVLVSLGLGAMTISFVDIVIWNGKRYITKVLNCKKSVKNIFSICIVLLFQYISLQYSTVQSIDGIISLGILLLIYNLLILLAINLLVLLMVQRWNITLAITSVLSCVWSIANYYVILFHGSPLYASELRNIKTAFAVAGTYTYSISWIVVLCGAILVMQLIYIGKYVKFDDRKFCARRFLYRLGMLTFSAGFIYIVAYCSGMFDKNEWNWKACASEDGFVVRTFANIKMSSNPISEPEGYELSKIFTNGGVSATNQKEEENQRPDMILILNESFYDLGSYADITTDVDYMKDFYSISDAVYGHAVVSNIGGGTNNSEFEYLYSKSMYLLVGDAPFSYLSRNLEERSVVKYLDNLGYTTTGMHCGGEQNYQRHIAYPTMGFDHIYLGPDAFSHITSNGNRSWKDEDNYKDLIEYYEKADDNPQFIYMLTFQNHGGYEQNEDSMDTVHVKEDFGGLTDDINEYLSSVKLSGEAFKALTEYYEKVDRDVIICMVGDHAPSFIKELSARDDLEIGDDTINKRSVPYVLWSNFGADFSMYTDYASMVDLVPMVLKGAGLPLSVFYDNILNLHEVLPIRTSDGKAVNKEMEISEYSLDSACDLWKQYYWLEYNSLLETEEYREALFEVQER